MRFIARSTSALFAGALFSLCACTTPATQVAQPDPAPKQTAPQLAKPDPQSITTRVNEAKQRLESSEAGQLIWRAIEAQGGLQQWYERGPINFRFNYKPLNERPPYDTVQLVDTWSAKAVHQLSDDPSVRFGWDGAQAWQQVPPDKKLIVNPRFWALTPYYFVAIPFVLADPGVNLAKLEPITIDERSFTRVKVTFDSGTGDAPDDYYIIYLEPESARVRAISYIVSYKGFFPEGGHSPEKLMYYDGDQRVDGITLPTHYRTFSLKEGMPDAHVTDITLEQVSFAPQTPASAFEMPEGASVVEKL